MSTIEGREVSRAELINAVFVPGVGNLDSAKFSGGVGSPVLSMTVSGHFLLAKVQGQGKQIVEVAVPLTNIKAVTLETTVRPLPKPMMKE
jgi:hypothetical protein